MIGHAIAAARFAVLSFGAIAGAALWHPPTRATCPIGWYVEGVRPSGKTRCRPVPPPRCGEPVPPDNGPCPRDERSIPLEIHCTGGSHPIVVGDGRTVGCQR